MKWVAAIRGAENRSAARHDAADFFECQFKGFLREDQAVEAIGDADDLPAILKDGGFRGGADYGVEAGRIAASGANADAANV